MSGIPRSGPIYTSRRKSWPRSKCKHHRHGQGWIKSILGDQHNRHHRLAMVAGPADRLERDGLLSARGVEEDHVVEQTVGRTGLLADGDVEHPQ